MAGLLAFAGHAVDSYPTRPIRMIVLNGANSAGDILGRLAFVRASKILGQQIVIDNRVGAGGIIGVEIVACAASDGHALLATAFAALGVAPHTFIKGALSSSK